MGLYRLLLHLCPATFRDEYGAEMCAIVARRRREASTPFGAAAVWLEVVADLLITAARVHVDVLVQDLRYTWRTLRRSLGFTLTAIIVAALGIGANTAVFSITDHVLVRPLPFADADRLVDVWQDQSSRGYSRLEPSPPNYRDWKQMNTVFEGMGVYHWLSVNMVGTGAPERLDGAGVSADLFPLIGARPALGRLFRPEDDRYGAPGTLLLSDTFWKLRFGADRGVLGRKVLLDGEPFIVIGVMPPDFYFPRRDMQIWRPNRFSPEDYKERDNNWLHVIAKLKRGVSLAQARADMRIVGAQLARQYKDDANTSVTVIPLRDEISSRTHTMLLALLGASLCVLLIACTNLANLLLARAMTRQKELAVRTALGAGRERLVRQLLTESLVLALCAGVLGIAIAVAAIPLLGALVPTALPIADAPGLDGRMLAFAMAITLITGLGFGVLPALHACRSLRVSGLQEGSRGGVGGRRERVRSALVVAEVAASVALVISAGLLIRALERLRDTDPGFRTANVLTLRTTLPPPQYDITARRARFYDDVLAQVRALPGVSKAAYISFLPMLMRGGVFPVVVEGQPVDGADLHLSSMRFVTPGFFDTLEIPLKQGRDVSEADTQKTLSVAVVSDSFVKRYWPGQNPIGRKFEFATATRTVVGVVGDVRVRGLEMSSEPQVYLPYKQVPDGYFSWFAPKDLALRLTGDPAAVLPPIRRIIGREDAELPISDVRMLSDIVAEDTVARVVQVRVLGAFALVAFLLAGIGVHGLLAFTVSQRAPEIGVRIAIGAQSRDILGLILGQGARLAAIGIVIGSGVAYVGGRLIQAILVGVAPGDATTFGAGIALSVVMAAAGALLPALRAVRVDPMTVIRIE